MTATVMMFFLRPYRSDRRPPIAAPKAAPRVRLDVTIDCWKALSPSPPSDGPLGEKGKRARDDARVVPEEQTAKGRDGADGEQALIDPLTV